MPSSDIHLFLNPELPHFEDLRIFGATQPLETPEVSGWQEHTLNLDCTLTSTARIKRPLDHPPGAVTQLPSATAGVLRVETGGSPGAAIFEVEVRIAPSLSPARQLLRVSTHADVLELINGQNSRTLFAGRADRTISMFARVPAVSGEPALPQVVDITGHSCLKYASANEAIATVTDDGRIWALSPGTTQVVVWLKDLSSRGVVTVDIHVRPPLSEHSQARFEDLTPQTIRTSRRLFFLAEGFKDGNRFFDMARVAAYHLMHDGENKPFKYLRDHFHCVGIFIPSQDQGVTFAARIVPDAAAPPSIPTWKSWQPTATDPLPPWDGAIARERDSIHGLCWGRRPSQHFAPRLRSGTVTESFFFKGDDARTPEPDERCLDRYSYGPDAAMDPRIARRSYIDSIVAMSGFSLAPDDRVVFLIDDSFYGGVYQTRVVPGLGNPPSEPASVSVAVSWGQESGLLDVFAPNPLCDREIHDRSRSVSELAARVAHEIAHTYQLADEYESLVRRRTYPLQGGGAIGSELWEVNYNIHTDISINATFDPANPQLYVPLRTDTSATPPISATGAVDAEKIRWDFHRIKQISNVVSIVRVAGSQFFDYRIVLGAGEARRWLATDEIFVRPRLSVTIPNSLPEVTPISGVIFDVDVPNNAVVARLSREWNAPASSPRLLMYTPVRSSDDTPARLIDRHVRDHLGQHGPFPRAVACTSTPPVANGVDVPPSIANYRRPAIASTTIGLYEGGATESCDIYRPTGMCRLRRSISVSSARSIVPFCFVCAFVMVDIIDPLVHEMLEKDYPV